VIDPACSIVFEAERSDPAVMERPPRKPGERLFTARALVLGFALGLGVLAAVAAVYGLALRSGRSPDEARAAAFATLVFGNLALILVNRSSRLTLWETFAHANRALWWIFGGTLAALGAVIYVPAIAEVFRFEPVPAGEAIGAALAGAASVLWYDLLKLAKRATASTPYR